MAVETKDILGWVITGGLGLAGLILNLLTRRDTKRREAQARDSAWSLRRETGRIVYPSDVLFRLRLEDPKQHRYRLLKIVPHRPRGVEIAAKTRSPIDRSGNWMLLPKAFGSELVADEDLLPSEQHGRDGNYPRL